LSIDAPLTRAVALLLTERFSSNSLVCLRHVVLEIFPMANAVSTLVVRLASVAGLVAHVACRETLAGLVSHVACRETLAGLVSRADLAGRSQKNP
jgi:hypothetical protein